MDNHLIVGLGGTGGKVIRSLRKMIYQNWRSEDPGNVNIRYLYVDSETSFMKDDDDSWKTLGVNVQLNRQSQLEIGGMNLESIITNLQDYPGIRYWIGNREQWSGILQASQGAKIAGGQKRRLGRFLVASKVIKFNDIVDTHVREMAEGGQVGTTFHICAGLAGGTGSGALLDVITQIRNRHKRKEDRIILYLLLPDQNPPKEWLGPNYHANGYAAALELNALAVGNYAPHDISGQTLKGGDHSGESLRLHVQDPFDCCYVITNENEAGVGVDVDKELPEIIASFLYHKIITAIDIGSSGFSKLHRQENYEIGQQAIEGEREFSGGPETRTRRFFAFGIKQLAYPEEEILEYLTFSFAQQAALQLRFNNWADGIGFTDRAKHSSFDGTVRNRETQARWRISDHHLTLSQGILDDEITNKKWREIPAEWSSTMTNLLLLVQQDPNKEQWLDKLYKMADKRFNDDYRGVGVRQFYASRRDIRHRHVRQIRETIERELLEAWLNGDHSMQELSQILADLRQELEERYKGTEGKIQKQEEVTKAALARMQEIDQRWTKIGPLSAGLLNKREKALKEKASALEQYLVARTWTEAWHFARELLRDVMQEFDELKGRIEEAGSRLVQAIDEFEGEIAARCVDEGESDIRKQVVRFYDPAAVRSLSDRLIKNQDVQKTQTAQIRTKIAESIGTTLTFARFNERIGLSTLKDVLQRQAADNARAAHNNLTAGEGLQRLLGISIVDKLRERFASDRQGLRKYLTEVVKQAQTYVRFDDAQKNKSGPGIPVDQNCFSTFTIIVPEAPEHPDFVELLEKTFKGAVAEGVTTDVVRSPRRKNEIVILNVTSAFPLRFADSLSFLRKAYERRLEANGGAAALELHIEGDGTVYPNLYPPEQEEILQNIRPYLLLASALNLFTTKTNRDGQTEQISFAIKDEYGMAKDIVPLGANLLQASERVTPELQRALRGAVIGELSDSKYDDSALRQSIVDNIVTQVALLEKTADPKTYLRFSDGGRKAIDLLKKTELV